MTLVKKGDYIGYSSSGIDDALHNALQEVGEYSHFEIVETRGSLINENKPHYQITITAFFE